MVGSTNNRQHLNTAVGETLKQCCCVGLFSNSLCGFSAQFEMCCSYAIFQGYRCMYSIQHVCTSQITTEIRLHRSPELALKISCCHTIFSTHPTAGVTAYGEKQKLYQQQKTLHPLKRRPVKHMYAHLNIINAVFLESSSDTCCQP